MVRQERRDRDSDYGVEAIPDKVEAGDLIGKKLDEEEDAACGQDPCVREPVQPGREYHPLQPSQKAEGQDRCIDVQARREACRNDQRRDVACRKAHFEEVYPSRNRVR